MQKKMADRPDVILPEVPIRNRKLLEKITVRPGRAVETSNPQCRNKMAYKPEVELPDVYLRNQNCLKRTENVGWQNRELIPNAETKWLIDWKCPLETGNGRQ